MVEGLYKVCFGEIEECGVVVIVVGWKFYDELLDKVMD